MQSAAGETSRIGNWSLKLVPSPSRNDAVTMNDTTVATHQEKATSQYQSSNSANVLRTILGDNAAITGTVNINVYNR